MSDSAKTSSSNKQKPNELGQLETTAIKWIAHLNSPELTEKEEKQFLTWLNASPANQAAYIEAERLWQLGGAAGRVEVPAPSWTLQAWQGWSAACAMAILVAFAFFQLSPTPTTIEHYQTSIGEQKEITLEDNSLLILNTNSKVSVKYEKNQRIATLQQGEALFDVQSNPKRPFDVITETGRVRVLGTRFAVKHTSEDTVITVIEGRVGLSKHSPATEEFEPMTVVGANQQASIKQVAAGTAPIPVDANIALAWRNKQLIYNGETLGQAIAELNRYFEQSITLKDVRLSDKRVVAVIHLDEFENAVFTLAHSLKLEPEFDNNNKQVTLVNK